MEAQTVEEAWLKVYDAVRCVQPHILPPPSADYMFGLVVPAIVNVLEFLPTSSLCSLYRFKFNTALEAAKISLPLNESGCARGEARRMKRPATVLAVAQGGDSEAAVSGSVSVSRGIA